MLRPPPSPSSDKIQADLIRTFASVTSPVLMDVAGADYKTGRDNTRSIEVEGPPSLEKMQRLAQAMKLVATLSDGTLCLVQSPEMTMDGAMHYGPLFRHWLSTMPPQTMQAFMAGPQPDTALGPVGSYYAENLGPDEPSRKGDLVNKHYSVQLSVSFAVDYTDSTGHAREAILAAPIQSHGTPSYVGRPLTNGRPLPPAGTGPLDFGTGYYGPLQNVLKKADARFGTYIMVDRREAEANVFIKGAFTEETFAAAIKTLCQATEAGILTRKDLASIDLQNRYLKEYAAICKNAAAQKLIQAIMDGRSTFSKADFEGLNDTAMLSGGNNLPAGTSFTMHPLLTITTDTGTNFMYTSDQVSVNGHASADWGLGQQTAALPFPKGG